MCGLLLQTLYEPAGSSRHALRNFQDRRARELKIRSTCKMDTHGWRPFCGIADLERENGLTGTIAVCYSGQISLLFGASLNCWLGVRKRDVKHTQSPKRRHTTHRLKTPFVFSKSRSLTTSPEGHKKFHTTAARRHHSFTSTDGFY